jgi:hypothetical protein
VKNELRAKTKEAQDLNVELDTKNFKLRNLQLRVRLLEHYESRFAEFQVKSKETETTEGGQNTKN